MHQNDLIALDFLCRVHNAARDHIIHSHQEIIEAHMHEMAAEIEQLRQLRHDLMACFKLAQEAIEARDDTHPRTMLYVPPHLRNR